MIKEWLEKQRMKAALLQVFRDANISVSYSYGNSNGKVYPKIRKIHFDYTQKTAVCYFTLPTGLDPKELQKKKFCFHQVFGKTIELSGEVKEFKLTVFAAQLPTEVKYDYKAYVPNILEKCLPIVAGIDVNGELIVFDLIKNPHLLIAGETGSGKSTQLRSVLTTLIQALPPKRLELYLCDLKRSEFHLFRQIKHVKGLFVSPGEIMPMLLYLQKEMQRRGDLLDQHELTNIDDLTAPPPYIVLCIDEVALLQNETKLMQLVEEISSIGRALGVFLILSMQRPDSKVLDGKLKNNLTVRMGFKCADLINSRIIGTPGSENLKVNGRMLVKLPKFSGLKEVQAPYLTIQEAKKILTAYKSPKNKNGWKQSQNTSNNVIDLKESEFSIFEVLDE